MRIALKKRVESPVRRDEPCRAKLIHTIQRSPVNKFLLALEKNCALIVLDYLYGLDLLCVNNKTTLEDAAMWLTNITISVIDRTNCSNCRDCRDKIDKYALYLYNIENLLNNKNLLNAKNLSNTKIPLSPKQNSVAALGLDLIKFKSPSLYLSNVKVLHYVEPNYGRDVSFIIIDTIKHANKFNILKFIQDMLVARVSQKMNTKVKPFLLEAKDIGATKMCFRINFIGGVNPKYFKFPGVVCNVELELRQRGFNFIAFFVKGITQQCKRIV